MPMAQISQTIPTLLRTKIFEAVTENVLCMWCTLLLINYRKYYTMFNLDKFIADYVINRPVSMFAKDIEANKDILTQEIKGKKVCVIGGAGSIGS